MTRPCERCSEVKYNCKTCMHIKQYIKCNVCIKMVENCDQCHIIQQQRYEEYKPEGCMDCEENYQERCFPDISKGIYIYIYMYDVDDVF